MLTKLDIFLCILKYFYVALIRKKAAAKALAGKKRNEKPNVAL